jgi:hypothetical protein
MVSLYIGFQEMMHKQHYPQCQIGMQVTDLAIQARGSSGYDGRKTRRIMQFTRQPS